MNAIDFEYDGHNLSDFGFVICDLDGSNGVVTVDAGSQITFNRVSRHNGKRYSLTSTSYDNCIEATFQICKDPCKYDDISMTKDEYRDIMRWLNRNKFYKFRLIDDEYFGRDTCYYDASFNIDKLLVDDKLYGLQLNMVTNRPFGYGEENRYEFNVTSSSDVLKVYDMSDEIGRMYPNITINVKSDGNLTITNTTYNSVMVINNCSAGELITVNGDTMVVTTSLDSHKIYKDFNFEYMIIANTYNNRLNEITVSLPCEITFSYSPIIKDSPS